ncbi:MAG: alkaline phosphatase [Cytophagaceae bacterium]|nr:alkaline phosphatase [Cytophagaceae bacterium]
MKTIHLFCALFFLFCLSAKAQQTQSTYKFHSHNDYEQEFPFWKAYIHGANSIEADVYLKNGKLYVTHAEAEIKEDNTLQHLYFDPIENLIEKGGFRELQLLVDLKSDAKKTLSKIIEALEDYPGIRQSNKLIIAISGNRPPAAEYGAYPDYIWFDHQSLDDLDTIDLSKVAMISKGFSGFSHWNGLGRPVAADMQKIKDVVAKAHEYGKPFRFWGTPDTRTAWSKFAKMGVDYVNTDHPDEVDLFLKSLDLRTYQNPEQTKIYKPRFDYDPKAQPKNVILLIGDGNGLSQISSAMIANGGELNLTQLQNIGLIKTSSYDDLVTDSAAGATAMATGEKTNNRAIGTNADGQPIKNITEILGTKGYITGLMTTDEITGATPSAFYAHEPERDNSDAILEDLALSQINFYVSSKAIKIPMLGIPQKVDGKNAKDYLEREAFLPAIERGAIFPEFFEKVLGELEKQEKPYFLMVEGAKIDSNGHTNNIKGIVTEMLDFDQAVRAALMEADKNKNTLVIITADHETSGLGIMQGSLENGEVEAGFLSNDHTASMVPIFAYGPQSQHFTGVFENTEIFHKIMKALEIKE